MNSWTSVNALYQIYPRSYFDTNHDGIGDLPGIIAKLDYLKGKPDSLGVDAIWISPFYRSPMADFGYDVADYCDVDPIFGSLDDVKRLLDEAHQRNIKVMIDFVPNHTSAQHGWFKQAISSKDNPYRDYYIWHDPKPDGSPPNNWVSIFSGPAWTLDKVSGQYYMHSFLSEQPDLNWDNPKVRQEMQDILRFWLDLGVDGFRADAVWHMSKDAQLRDDPLQPKHKKGDPAYWAYKHKYCKYGPKLFDYLKELTDVVESYPDRFMVFEHYPDGVHGDSTAQYRAFYGVQPQVSAPFNFEGMFVPWSAAGYEDYIRRFQSTVREGDTPVFCFSNHDQPRIATRFGREQARLVAMLLLTLPGMPTIYYGDEIGMEDGVVLPEQIQDPSARDNELGGRDPERTPMQWDATRHAGFSDVEPWLPVAEGYASYNVAHEIAEDDSYLSLYKQLLALRRRDDTLVRGRLELIHTKKDSDVLSFERHGSTTRYRVVLNFADAPREVFLSYGAKVVLSTHPTHRLPVSAEGEIVLAAYEAVIVRL
jgi:alpha-glucosidase